MPDCIFCNRGKIKDDILLETKNFFVKVGIGIIAPGHVMLITKKHFKCFGKSFLGFAFGNSVLYYNKIVPVLF